MNQRNQLEKSSAVCLDSAEVKRIRESSQLTQLYVSKVVGVTTDTISRWENNRYPTIRRENALKLAEALDVPLADILQKPVADDAGPAPVTPKKATALWWGLGALLMVGVLATYWVMQRHPQVVAAGVTAVRLLPAFAAPGSSIPVRVVLTQHVENNGLIVRESFPPGWKIVQANPPASSLDNVNGVARWIVKAGDNCERIVYLLQVDPQAKPASEENFRGEIVVSSQGSPSAVPVLGVSEIVVAQVHWADGDGDHRIDDGEMLEASYTIADMEGVHIDWLALEKLWDAGSYAWNEKQGKFLPQAR